MWRTDRGVEAREKKKRSPDTVEAAIVLTVLVLVVGGGLIGWVVGRESGSVESAVAAVVATTEAPAGHAGAGLPPEAFGDPARGSELWNEKGCSNCHAISGVGGTDAPPLDYMREHLSAREVANMSGDIWNHLPMMIPRFEEEGVPFPTFEGDEMADLIAFMHGTSPVSASEGGGASHSDEAEGEEP